MSKTDEKVQKFVSKTSTKPLEKSKRKSSLWKTIYAVCGIVLPAILSFTAAAKPQFYSSIPLLYIIFCSILLAFLFLFLHLKVERYNSITNSLIKEEIRSSVDARNIDALVDRYSAVLASVAKAINDKCSRSQIYGIITEAMYNEIIPRLPHQVPLSICIYRRCESKAKLIWHNEVNKRKLKPSIKYYTDEIESSNKDDYYFGEQLFLEEDNTILRDAVGINSSFRQMDKEIKKHIKTYLGRTKVACIDSYNIGYYVEIIVYDEIVAIDSEMAIDIQCDIIDPMLDICRIIDSLYGGDLDGKDKNTAQEEVS